MSSNEMIEPGSDIDLAIEQALRGANLRPGDAADTSTAFLLHGHQPSAAEAGVAAGDADGD